VSTRAYYRLAVDVLNDIRNTFQIEQLISDDMNRMVKIMRKYADAEFDYADVAIIAVAERLKVERIATLDRRGFLTYRPTHCDHFTLLPE